MTDIRRDPMQTCLLCGQQEIVKPDGRGFPPRITERRLRKKCEATGCPCKPKYTAGYYFRYASPINDWDPPYYDGRPDALS